ncbi:MAG: DUF4412 domain-containing protein [Chlorobiaceae bacterium]|jgi:hypothetical protein|nr:DUF4412 domain-containing protein [Chlorobiaceae bacterium]
MKKTLLLMTFLCCGMLFSLNAIASGKFTGLMDMKLNTPGGNADITYYFGTGSQRMDMVMRMNRIPEPLKTTVITKAGSPDEALFINHETRNYSIVNLRTAAENATLLDFDSNYKLKRLGKASIKGYQCEHISLTSSTEKLELWVTSGLGDFSTFRILQSQNPRLSNTSLSRTLKDAGVEGFPAKIVQKNENGLYTMELIAVKPKELAATVFTVPAGYTKTQAATKPISAKQKEHLRNLMEKMKKFEE